MANATITPSDNGPYLVEGPVSVADADGTEYDVPERTTIFLCRCGGSGAKPFCDGTHEKANFAAVNRAASGSTPMRTPAVASR
jgi:CDGSH-type Zn-finger protein